MVSKIILLTIHDVKACVKNCMRFKINKSIEYKISSMNAKTESFVIVCHNEVSLL